MKLVNDYEYVVGRVGRKWRVLFCRPVHGQHPWTRYWASACEYPTLKSLLSFHYIDNEKLPNETVCNQLTEEELSEIFLELL